MGIPVYPPSVDIATPHNFFFSHQASDTVAYICLVTRGYLPLGYLLILAFRHVQILQPLQHLVCSVKMKVAFRCGLAHSCVICIGIYSIFLLFIIRGSCSLKSSFLSCSFCVSQVTLVKLAWLPKLLRHTKPQTYDISFSLMPPPGLSLTWREAGNVFSRLCHQRSTHCVPEYVSSVSEAPRTC